MLKEVTVHLHMPNSNNKSADNNFCESKTVRAVLDTSIGHADGTVSARLLFRITQWIAGHDSQRCNNRTQIREAFASLDALSPSVIHIFVSITSAVLEPSTAASATAEFERFLGSAALGACKTGGF